MSDSVCTRSVRARAVWACAGVLACVGAGAVGGPVDVFWLNAADGQWGVAANWNPATVPNNFGGTEFNAFLQVAGAPYVVSVDANFTIRDFTMSSIDATLNLLSNRLTVEGAFSQGANTISGTGGLGELFVDGPATLTGSTLTGFSTMRSAGALTLSGATFNGVTAVMSQGTLNFIGAAASEICDTCIDHEGLAINWSGDGGIMMGGGGEIRNGALSTFTVSGSSSITLVTGNAAVRNAGTMLRTGAGATSILGVSLDNTGTVDVAGGSLAADTVDNLVGGTLTGGKWTVRAGSTLDFVGASVTTNEAEVTLEGAGSAFSAFTDNVSTNGAAGTIALEGGRSLTTGGAFTNDGSVRVGAGSTFRVAPGSGLTNFNGGTKTLSGGVYDLRGLFVFDGADVVVLNSDVTLRGVGAAVQNQAGGNALLQSSTQTNTIGAGGKMAIREGITFTTGGDMLVAAGGLLDIDTGTTFKVADGFDLLNISPTGVLNDAGIILKGTLQASNADVEEIGAGADLTLDGDGSQLLNGAGQSAFAGLLRIDSGALTIKGGRDLTVTNPTTAFSVTGSAARLTVGPGMGADGPVPGETSDLTVTGNMALSGGAVRLDGGTLSIGGSTGLTQTGGTITLVGGGKIEFTGGGGFVQSSGSLKGSGSFSGDVTLDGTLAPGASAGTISVAGDVRVGTGAVFEMEIISASALDLLAIDGSLTFVAPEGGSAGTLRVLVDSGYTPTLGDLFEIITFTQPRNGDFDVIEGLTLGSGLSFERSYTDHALVLRVVPGPGGLGVLAMGLVSALRRRR